MVTFNRETPFNQGDQNIPSGGGQKSGQPMQVNFNDLLNRVQQQNASNYQPQAPEWMSGPTRDMNVGEKAARWVWDRGEDISNIMGLRDAYQQEWQENKQKYGANNPMAYIATAPSFAAQLLPTMAGGLIQDVPKLYEAATGSDVEQSDLKTGKIADEQLTGMQRFGDVGYVAADALSFIAGPLGKGASAIAATGGKQALTQAARTGAKEAGEQALKEAGSTAAELSAKEAAKRASQKSWDKASWIENKAHDFAVSKGLSEKAATRAGFGAGMLTSIIEEGAQEGIQYPFEQMRHEEDIRLDELKENVIWGALGGGMVHAGAAGLEHASNAATDYARRKIQERISDSTQDAFQTQISQTKAQQARESDELLGSAREYAVENLTSGKSVPTSANATLTHATNTNPNDITIEGGTFADIFVMGESEAMANNRRDLAREIALLQVERGGSAANPATDQEIAAIGKSGMTDDMIDSALSERIARVNEELDSIADKFAAQDDAAIGEINALLASAGGKVPIVFKKDPGTSRESYHRGYLSQVTGNCRSRGGSIHQLVASSQHTDFDKDAAGFGIGRKAIRMFPSNTSLPTDYLFEDETDAPFNVRMCWGFNADGVKARVNSVIDQAIPDERMDDSITVKAEDEIGVKNKGINPNKRSVARDKITTPRKEIDRWHYRYRNLVEKYHDQIRTGSWSDEDAADFNKEFRSMMKFLRRILKESPANLTDSQIGDVLGGVIEAISSVNEDSIVPAAIMQSMQIDQGKAFGKVFENTLELQERAKFDQGDAKGATTEAEVNSVANALASSIADASGGLRQAQAYVYATKDVLKKWVNADEISAIEKLVLSLNQKLESSSHKSDALQGWFISNVMDLYWMNIVKIGRENGVAYDIYNPAGIPLSVKKQAFREAYSSVGEAFNSSQMVETIDVDGKYKMDVDANSPRKDRVTEENFEEKWNEVFKDVPIKYLFDIDPKYVDTIGSKTQSMHTADVSNGSIIEETMDVTYGEAFNSDEEYRWFKSVTDKQDTAPMKQEKKLGNYARGAISVWNDMRKVSDAAVEQVVVDENGKEVKELTDERGMKVSVRKDADGNEVMMVRDADGIETEISADDVVTKTVYRVNPAQSLFIRFLWSSFTRIVGGRRAYWSGLGWENHMIDQDYYSHMQLAAETNDERYFLDLILAASIRGEFKPAMLIYQEMQRGDLSFDQVAELRARFINELREICNHGILYRMLGGKVLHAFINGDEDVFKDIQWLTILDSRIDYDSKIDALERMLCEYTHKDKFSGSVIVEALRDGDSMISASDITRRLERAETERKTASENNYARLSADAKSMARWSSEQKEKAGAKLLERAKRNVMAFPTQLQNAAIAASLNKSKEDTDKGTNPEPFGHITQAINIHHAGDSFAFLSALSKNAGQAILIEEALNNRVWLASFLSHEFREDEVVWLVVDGKKMPFDHAAFYKHCMDTSHDQSFHGRTIEDGATMTGEDVIDCLIANPKLISVMQQQKLVAVNGTNGTSITEVPAGDSLFAELSGFVGESDNVDAQLAELEDIAVWELIDDPGWLPLMTMCAEANYGEMGTAEWLDKVQRAAEDMVHYIIAAAVAGKNLDTECEKVRARIDSSIVETTVEGLLSLMGNATEASRAAAEAGAVRRMSGSMYDAAHEAMIRSTMVSMISSDEELSGLIDMRAVDDAEVSAVVSETIDACNAMAELQKGHISETNSFVRAVAAFVSMMDPSCVATMFDLTDEQRESILRSIVGDKYDSIPDEKRTRLMAACPVDGFHKVIQTVADEISSARYSDSEHKSVVSSLVTPQLLLDAYNNNDWFRVLSTFSSTTYMETGERYTKSDLDNLKLAVHVAVSSGSTDVEILSNLNELCIPHNQIVLRRELENARRHSAIAIEANGLAAMKQLATTISEGYVRVRKLVKDHNIDLTVDDLAESPAYSRFFDDRGRDHVFNGNMPAQINFTNPINQTIYQNFMSGMKGGKISYGVGLDGIQYLMAGSGFAYLDRGEHADLMDAVFIALTYAQEDMYLTLKKKLELAIGSRVHDNVSIFSTSEIKKVEIGNSTYPDDKKKEAAKKVLGEALAAIADRRKTLARVFGETKKEHPELKWNAKHIKALIDVMVPYVDIVHYDEDGKAASVSVIYSKMFGDEFKDTDRLLSASVDDVVSSMGIDLVEFYDTFVANQGKEKAYTRVGISCTGKSINQLANELNEICLDMYYTNSDTTQDIDTVRAAAEEVFGDLASIERYEMPDVSRHMMMMRGRETRRGANVQLSSQMSKQQRAMAVASARRLGAQDESIGMPAADFLKEMAAVREMNAIAHNDMIEKGIMDEVIANGLVTHAIVEGKYRGDGRPTALSNIGKSFVKSNLPAVSNTPWTPAFGGDQITLCLTDSDSKIRAMLDKSMRYGHTFIAPADKYSTVTKWMKENGMSLDDFGPIIRSHPQSGYISVSIDTADSFDWIKDSMPSAASIDENIDQIKIVLSHYGKGDQSDYVLEGTTLAWKGDPIRITFNALVTDTILESHANAPEGKTGLKKVSRADFQDLKDALDESTKKGLDAPRIVIGPHYSPSIGRPVALGKVKKFIKRLESGDMSDFSINDCCEVFTRQIGDTVYYYPVLLMGNVPPISESVDVTYEEARGDIVIKCKNDNVDITDGGVGLSIWGAKAMARAIKKFAPHQQFIYGPDGMKYPVKMLTDFEGASNKFKGLEDLKLYTTLYSMCALRSNSIFFKQDENGNVIGLSDFAMTLSDDDLARGIMNEPKFYRDLANDERGMLTSFLADAETLPTEVRNEIWDSVKSLLAKSSDQFETDPGNLMNKLAWDAKTGSSVQSQEWFIDRKARRGAISPKEADSFKRRRTSFDFKMVLPHIGKWSSMQVFWAIDHSLCPPHKIYDSSLEFMFDSEGRGLVLDTEDPTGNGVTRAAFTFVGIPIWNDFNATSGRPSGEITSSAQNVIMGSLVKGADQRSLKQLIKLSMVATRSFAKSDEMLSVVYHSRDDSARKPIVSDYATDLDLLVDASTADGSWVLKMAALERRTARMKKVGESFNRPGKCKLYATKWPKREAAEIGFIEALRSKDPRCEKLQDAVKRFREAWGLPEDIPASYLWMLYSCEAGYDYIGSGISAMSIDSMAESFENMTRNATSPECLVVSNVAGSKRIQVPVLPRPVISYLASNSTVLKKAHPGKTADKIYEAYLEKAMEVMDTTFDTILTSNAAKRNALSSIVDYVYQTNGREPEMLDTYMDICWEDRHSSTNAVIDYFYMPEGYRSEVAAYMAEKESAKKKHARIQKAIEKGDYVSQTNPLTIFGRTVHSVDVNHRASRAMAGASSVIKFNKLAEPYIFVSAVTYKVPATIADDVMLWASNGVNIAGRDFKLGPYVQGYSIDKKVLNGALATDDFNKVLQAYMVALVHGSLERFKNEVTNGVTATTFLSEIRKEMGFFEKGFDFICSAAGGFNIGSKRMAKLFLKRFAMLAGENNHTWLNEQVPGTGMTELEYALANDPAKWFMQTVKGENADQAILEQAFNFSRRADIAHKNLVSAIWGEICRRHKGADLFSSVFVTPFMTFATNVTGRWLNIFAPISTIHFMATTWVRINQSSENSGRLRSEGISVDASAKSFDQRSATIKQRFWNTIDAINVDEVEMFDNIREALYYDLMHMSIPMLAIVIGSSACLEPPDDPDKWGVVEEWKWFGQKIKQQWWIDDILGPVIAMACCHRSAQLGKPRVDMLVEAMADLCYSFPALRIGDIVDHVISPDGITSDYSDAVDMYADSAIGSPGMSDFATWNMGTGILAYSVNLLTPAMLKNWYNNNALGIENMQYEHTYNRRFKNPDELDYTNFWDRETEKVSYSEAQLRKASRKNPVLGLLLDTVFHTNEYMAHEMPLSKRYDEYQLDSMKRYGTKNDDGSQKTDEELNQIVIEIIGKLNSTDDMEALYQSGFLVPSETRDMVSKFIAEQMSDAESKYSKAQEEGVFDYYRLADEYLTVREEGADPIEEFLSGYGVDISTLDLSKVETKYSLGEALSTLIRNKYKETKNYWSNLYYDKLWSQELRRGLATYLIRNQIYLTDDNGDAYTSGFMKQSTGLNPFNIAQDVTTRDDGYQLVMAGPENDRNAQSIVTGQSAGMRGLIPVETDFTKVPDPTEFMADSSKFKYQLAKDKLSSGFDKDDDDDGNGDDKKKKKSPYGTGYGKRSGGGGGYSRSGGGGGYPNIYSNSSVLNPSSPRVMNTDRIQEANYDYLRPSFETKGSREAYKREDI